jgi:hypothetical protein
MADIKISALPTATVPLSGTEIVPLVQSGVTVQTPISGIASNLSSATIVANTSSAALRVTQTGAGNAILVEDSANPDSTPFVVNNTGQVLIGATLAPFGSTNLGLFSNTADTVPPYQDFFKNRIGGVVASGDVLGSQGFWGYDGATYLEGARIDSLVDGTPGLNDMPTYLRFLTTADGAATPTERMRINNAGGVSIGTSSASAGTTLSVSKDITGATTSFGTLTNGAIQSNVTVEARLFATSASTAAAAFTLGGLSHFYAAQATIGAGSTITSQYGYAVDAGITAATNNYGFYSNISTGTTRTITNVARTSNVATITTSAAHGYTLGQSVTVAATTNTSFNGTFTITGVPTTSTFTYADVDTDLASTADTGSTVVVGRWNFYASGTAGNYFAGNMLIGNTGGTSYSVPNIIGTLTTSNLQVATTGTSVSASLQQYGDSAQVPAALTLAKSRSDTIGAQTIITSGDDLGAVLFAGSDGTSFINAASILTEVDGTPGTNDMPGRLIFSTTADGAASPTERMRISSVGFTTLTGSFARSTPVTKTASFALAATENSIICNGAGIVVTLPAASAWPGREVMIKTIAAQAVVSASANVVPLTTAVAGTAILAATAGRFATLISDGTNWVIMQAN